jgi:uncharacterized membrane protein
MTRQAISGQSAIDTRSPAPHSAPRITPFRFFLPFAWLFAALFAIITPPFQVPDEIQQFHRAYQVSTGRLTAYQVNGKVGGYLPASLEKFQFRAWGNRPFTPELKAAARDIWASRKIPLDPQSQKFYFFGNVSWHSPTNYFAQASAIALARALGAGPMMIFYAGRFGNFFCWSLLVYCAIRLIPIAHWTMFLLALTPMCVAQAASLSADATVNGISFLFVAVAVRFALTRGPIDAGRYFALIFLGAAVALAKTAYLPLALLFFLIPREAFPSRRRYWLAFGLFMVVCFVAVVGWSLCTFGAQSYSMADVSPRRQAVFMLHHPLRMLHMEVGMLLAVPFISSIIGQLGWHEIRLYSPFTLVYFIMLFWTTQLGTRSDFRLSPRQRGVLAAAAAACWFAAFSLIYLTFTPVGGRSINGLQGRYMIPITPAFFLIFHRARGAPALRRENAIGLLILSFSAVFLAYTLSVLVRRFYIW